MGNPFARPHTTGEWLRSSICWTVSCLVACLLAYALVLHVLPFSVNLPFGVIPVSFCAAHALIWKRAVAGGRALLRYDEQHYGFSWTRLAANLWLMALTFFQVACLLGPLILIAWVLISFSAEPAAPATSSEPLFG